MPDDIFEIIENERHALCLRLKRRVSFEEVIYKLIRKAAKDKQGTTSAALP
jgi:hypothetical protein